MLILSRKPDEAIVIGDDIEICITKVEGDTVKLGIQAPKSVRIFRREVLDQIRESNKAAAVASSTALPKMPKPGGNQPKLNQSAKALLKRLGK
ncbi:MAG: carbon storage regulator CsrA [Verrucomicrobiota bacterium]